MKFYLSDAGNLHNLADWSNVEVCGKPSVGLISMGHNEMDKKDQEAQVAIFQSRTETNMFMLQELCLIRCFLVSFKLTYTA
ncbi:hypothetical protein OPV22_014883 [Ensete ventricosum]|uniref:Uncharacterized protein n=1 Tax=Ensete ventricosum TaxID=4639 RepID=A0AAV8QYS8_ENSVE|nr:hypothetical protein OPV22_014883 [Ensete ventricosum]